MKITLIRAVFLNQRNSLQQCPLGSCTKVTVQHPRPRLLAWVWSRLPPVVPSSSDLNTNSNNHMKITFLNQCKKKPTTTMPSAQLHNSDSATAAVPVGVGPYKVTAVPPAVPMSSVLKCEPTNNDNNNNMGHPTTTPPKKQQTYNNNKQTNKKPQQQLTQALHESPL